MVMSSQCCLRSLFCCARVHRALPGPHIMDIALEAAKNHILEYYEQYQVIDVMEGATTLSELPLVAAPRGKKSMKEFFLIVRNISQSDREAIGGAFVDGSLNVAALPTSVRSRDSLGESVKMQSVIEESRDECPEVLPLEC